MTVDIDVLTLTLAKRYAERLNIYVSNNHVFADTDERDAYFTAEPDELVDDLYILVDSVVYKYLGGDHEDDDNWMAISPIIKGERGEQGIRGETGEGVPEGGTAGQVLAKIDAEDFNTEWADAVASAGDVTYDNTDSELTAEDVQAAIDEVVVLAQEGGVIGNLDGGKPDSNFGGFDAIDGGGV